MVSKCHHEERKLNLKVIMLMGKFYIAQKENTKEGVVAPDLHSEVYIRNSGNTAGVTNHIKGSG